MLMIILPSYLNVQSTNEYTDPKNASKFYQKFDNTINWVIKQGDDAV